MFEKCDFYPNSSKFCVVKKKGEDGLPVLFVDFVAALIVACKQLSFPFYQTASLANILFSATLTNNDINKVYAHNQKYFSEKNLYSLF